MLLVTHKHLTYDVIRKYMDIAYKKAILFNPSFAIRRLIRGFRTGEFFWDVYYAMKFFMLPASRSALMSQYYAKDRWPQYDFRANPPEEVPYQVAKKTSQPKTAEKATTVRTPVLQQAGR